VAPALTFVLIFTNAFPFLENSKLIVRPRLALSLDGFGLFRGGTDDDIPVGGPCFHIRLDFHTYGFLS
jgi:hypothetical protein